MCKNKGPTCKVHLYFFIELAPAMGGWDDPTGKVSKRSMDWPWGQLLHAWQSRVRMRKGEPTEAYLPVNYD